MFHTRNVTLYVTEPKCLPVIYEYLVSYQPDSLLSATHVSKGGNPNATLRSDFVKIVFFDPMEVQQRDNATADNATSGINREELVERF